MKRPLGGWERNTALMHDEFFGAGLLLGCARLTGQVDITRLTEAWRAVAACHPALLGRLTLSAELEVSAGDEPPPVTVVRLPFQEVMEEEMSRPFDAQRGPLYRVHFCAHESGVDVLITIHHTIADGLSLARLLRDLLEVYTDPKKVRRAYSLPAAIEVTLNRRPSRVAYAAKFLLRAVKRMAAGLVRVPFSGWADFQTRRTRHLFVRWDEVSSDALLARCRQERTTVHGALLAAQAKAFAEVFLPGRKKVVLSSHSAVSWRSAAGRDDTRLGCDVSVPDATLVWRAEESFWEIARQAKITLAESVTESGSVPPNMPYQLLRHIIRAGVLEAERSRRFMGSLSTTNLGVLPFPREFGALRLEAFWFAVSRRVGDFPVMLHAHTLHQRLNLCFNYEEPLLSREQAQAFATATEMALERAIQSAA